MDCYLKVSLNISILEKVSYGSNKDFCKFDNKYLMVLIKHYSGFDYVALQISLIFTCLY